MKKLTLTPIKFDGQFIDGLLEMDGMAFEWNGVQFVVHEKRELYRFSDKDPLCVSHVDTGYGIGATGDTRDYMKAAKAAIARLDDLGVDRVKAALDKARATRITTRLSA